MTPQAEGSAPAHDEEPAGGELTYRSKLRAVAARRGIPLATIAVTVLIVVAVLDVNALLILLVWVLRRIILYIVLAVFFVLMLQPVVRLVERTGLHRGPSVAVVFVASVLIAGGIIVLFTGPLVHAITHFSKTLPTLVRQAEHGKGPLGHWLVRLHLEKWLTKNGPKIAADITKSLKPAQALSVGSAAVSTVVALATVGILTLFLLLDGPSLRAGLLSTMRPDVAARVGRVYRQTSGAVTGYVFGDALTSVIAGVVIGITLFVMGVPYPLLLGLWVALVDLLPLVGGLLAGVPVAIIAGFHSLPAFVVTVVVFLVYQQVENHVLNPIVMSRTVRLQPLWVLLAILIAGTLGDKIAGSLGAFVGALIGIPCGAAVQIVIKEVRRGPTPENPADLTEVAREPGAERSA